MCILARWRYFVRPFFRHSRRARRFLSALGGSLNVRSHFATTSHWPFAFAHDACSVLASCSLGGFGGVQWFLFVLAPPALCAHNYPRRFRE